MGYYRHHAIIVTGHLRERVERAHTQCLTILNTALDDMQPKRTALCLLSSVQESWINGLYSFCIFPDGSKEGWEMSDQMDKVRSNIINVLKSYGGYLDWAELRFGGDDDESEIIDCSNDMPPEVD